MATIPVNNPEIPFLGLLPGGFHPGMIIRIRGRVHGIDNWCQIFIQQGPALKPRDDVMLHLSIRSQDNAIVRNHYHNKQWGNEERSGQNPIQANEPFEILILAEDISYKIAVNGIHFCQFNHRLPLNLAKFISIEGSCEIQYILIENDIKGNVISHQQIRPTAPSMSSHDIRQPSNLPKPIPMPRPLHPPFPIPANSPNTAMINRERIQTFPIAVPRNPHNSISYNPAIPFCCPINGGMRVGMMVMVKGQILSHNGRCMINIQESTNSDINAKILLHMSIRLDEDEIVRNHYNKEWGHEERHGDNPIDDHETFEILILAEPALYKIAVNGKHFCTFNHRMPIHMGKFLVIGGLCQIQEAQIVMDGNH